MAEQHEFFSADDISHEEAVNHWNKTAEEFASYFAEGEEFYHKHIINPSMFDLLGDIEGKTILDLACGEGHFARKLSELAKRNVKVIGVDASEKMNDIATEKNEQFSDCLSFQVADACHMPQFQSNSFDIVVCNMALMDIKKYVEAIKEVARILKAKGIFVFSILHPCFWTPGSGWIRKHPEGTGSDNKNRWKVDNYHHRLVCKSPIKKNMQNETYYFHRTLGDYFSALRESGFVVSDLREPVPSKELIEKDTGLEPDLKMSTFLVVKSILLGEIL